MSMNQNKSNLKIKNSRNFFIKEMPLIFIIIISFIYTLVWSIITVDKYFALNQPVADLGDAMQTIWSTTHNSFNSTQLLINFFQSGGPYYLFWSSNFKGLGIFLLIFQSFFLGFSAVPLYLISKKELGSSTQATFISSIFLIYFPLSGINWFAFHFQAMFIPLFFLAYYFYVKQMKKMSFILFLIAGLVKFPFILFIAMFAIIQIILSLRDNVNGRKLEAIMSKERYLFILFILSFIIFILGYFLTIRYNLTISIYTHSSSANFNLFVSTAYSKFLTLLLIFIPFAFLPLFSKKWVLLYLPFIALMFYSNSNIYVFPHIFQLQYMSMIIPFIFLGFIDSLKGFPISTPRKTIFKAKVVYGREYKPIPKRQNVIIAIFLFVILFALFFQPYGSFNSYTSDNFSYSEQVSYNLTQYNYLVSEADLIPTNNPYVLMQNNMPELLPRTLEYNNTPLTVGLVAFAPDLNISNVLLNSFPRQIIGSKWTDVKIDYALGDGYTPNYFLSSYPGSPSTLEFLKVLYSSGIYGIYAQQGDVVLLKRNFNGSPILYKPYNEYYLTNQFQYLLSNISYISGEPTFANVSNHAIFRTAPLFFPPGIYNLSVKFRSRSNFSENNLSLSVVGSGTAGIIKSFNITSSDFKTFNTMETINLSFTLNTFLKFIYFEPYVNTWKGSLSIGNLSVKEINPL